MLKAVRIHLRQQMPNYRKPASFLIKETFPLPPYSSVIGMVHAACGWTEYHPMKVSIQGCSAGTVSDYATNYVFGISYDPGRHQYKVDAGNGKFDGINAGPKSYELLTDVELVLHIIPDDSALTGEICRKVLFPASYLSLGRYEDLVQIDRADEVVLENAEEDESYPAVYDIFVPLESLSGSSSQNLTGTVYRLNKVFAMDQTDRKKVMRYWKETVLVRHVCKGAALCSEKMLLDRQFSDIVFPA